MTLSFDDKLARYADLLVRTGVNLPQGGKLLVQAPIEAAPLVRLVTRAAYRAGAADVRVNYNDAHLGLALFEDGSDEAVDFLPDWHAAQREAMVADGYASIGRLSESVGSARFGTRYRLRDDAAARVPVDLAANARSYGVDVIEVAPGPDVAGRLEAAVRAAKASTRRPSPSPAASRKPRASPSGKGRRGTRAGSSAPKIGFSASTASDGSAP